MTDTDSQKYLRRLHLRQIYRKMVAHRAAPVRDDDIILEILAKYPKLTREEILEGLEERTSKA